MKAELGAGHARRRARRGERRAGEPRGRARRGEGGSGVIVRISGEGQYELADDAPRAPQRARQRGGRRRRRPATRTSFHAAFEELLAFVRSAGDELADDDLSTSDVILPPADLTFVEAGEEFTGEGLIPD